MADFQSSTHRHNWILSINDLAEKRLAANQRAVDALKKYGATRVEVQADGSLAYPGALTAGSELGEKSSSLPEPLSVDEELLMHRFYEQKIQQVCAAFSFPHKIQATAILYFKRFFLNWSVMEHDPKQIMLTCIYISCKVEEFHVSAEEFGKGIQQDPQAVLKNELCLLQGLNFDLIVYAPYRSLDGFIFDMEGFFQPRDDTFLQQLKELKEGAVFVIDSLMLTDVILLFPPGQGTLILIGQEILTRGVPMAATSLPWARLPFPGLAVNMRHPTLSFCVQRSSSSPDYVVCVVTGATLVVCVAVQTQG